VHVTEAEDAQSACELFIALLVCCSVQSVSCHCNELRVCVCVCVLELYVSVNNCTRPRLIHLFSICILCVMLQ